MPRKTRRLPDRPFATWCYFNEAAARCRGKPSERPRLYRRTARLQ